MVQALQCGQQACAPTRKRVNVFFAIPVRVVARMLRPAVVGGSYMM